MFKVSKNGKDFIYNAVQIQGSNVNKNTIQPNTFLEYNGDKWVGTSGSVISATGVNYSDYTFWNDATQKWEVGNNKVHIGNSAGKYNQSTNAISIGVNSGQNSQGTNSIAIGLNAGLNSQKKNSIAISTFAGQNSQGANSIAIGLIAGQNIQGNNSVAIGNQAGQINQGSNSIAIGDNTSNNFQGQNSVAIGNSAGYYNQADGSFALGNLAGYNNQGGYSFSLGAGAGKNYQGFQSIAIGSGTAENNQGSFSIAMSTASGQNYQGTYSIAIGYYAGQNSQGNNAIAIGKQAGQAGQHSNTIILNASGTALNSSTISSLYVDPVRNDNDVNFNTLTYNTTTKEIVYNSTKTFVIQHPEYESKYLVHACLEGPEAGVYYRGEGFCEKSTTITLPNYVKNLASELNVYVSIIQDENSEIIPTISSSKIIDRQYFKVFTNLPTYFNWLVIGKRSDIQIEVEKKDVELKNLGPYTWIS